jgi:hypothetical protein
MMEKYYVIGSSLLVAVCNFPPLAGGQLGFYDNLCWFSNPDPVVRFRWIFGTQTFWMVLMASSELVCFVILMSYMLRRRVRLWHYVPSVVKTDDNERRCA